jgi:hypothetical protein
MLDGEALEPFLSKPGPCKSSFSLVRVQDTRERVLPAGDGRPGGEIVAATGARSHPGVSRHRLFLEFLTENTRTHVR